MSRQTEPGGERSSEYFVPRDGINREVITADICYYLGRDALVKPGKYIDKETRTEIQGFYVTAYRELTSAMIDDLKADSARYEQEKRRKLDGVPYAGSNHYQNRSQPGYSGYTGGGSTHDSMDYSMTGYQTGPYNQGGTGAKQPYGTSYGPSGGYAAPRTGADVYDKGYDKGYDAQGYSTGGTQGGYSSTGYPSGGMATSQMPGVSYSGGSGGAPMRPPVDPSVKYAVQQDYSKDYDMQDAGAPQPGYGTGQPGRGYSAQQNPQSSYPYGTGTGQPQIYPPGAPVTQPVDLYYGRGPGGAYPVGSAAGAPYSATATAMPYSPGPDTQYDPAPRASAASPGTQAQVSNSGPNDRRGDRGPDYRDSYREGGRESRDGREGREGRDRREREREQRERDREREDRDRHYEKKQHRR